MNKAPDQLEQLWNQLLSRQPRTIKAAYTALLPADQKAVLAHLQRMTSEPGWQPEQRISAEAALKVLSPRINQDM